MGVGSAFTTVTLNSNVSLATLIFTNANSFGVADAGKTMTFANPFGTGTVSVQAGSSNAIGAAVVLSTNVSISTVSGTSLALTNSVSAGSGQTLTVSGPGTVALSGNNTYGPAAGSVGTTFGGGVLQLGNNNALGAGDLSVSASGTIQAGTALTLSNNIIDTTGTTTLDNNGNNVTLSGVISSSGAFAKNSAGTLTLNNANSYTGTTTINAGTVVLGNAGGIPGGVGYGNVTMNPNTLLNLNGNSVVLNGLNSSTNVTVDTLSGGSVTLTLGESGANGTFLGSITNSSGSLTLVKDGAGTETLGGTNGYTGGTTINAGTLQVGNGGTSGSLGSGPLLDNGSLAFNLTGTNAFAGNITGSGGVTLNNVGLSLWLTGNNTFTGGITDNGGSLWVTNSASLGVGPKTVLAAGGGVSLLTQIHLAGNVSIDPSISFTLSYNTGVLINESDSNTIGGPINFINGGGNPDFLVNSGLLTIANTVSTTDGNNPRTLFLDGPGNGLISGPMINSPGGVVLSLTKQGSGTWTLTYPGNTYSGATAVNGGTLIIDAAGNNQGNGAIAVNAGGTLIVNGVNYGTGAVTVATNGILGGVGYIYSAVTFQAGGQGQFTTSVSGSTPMTVYGNVTLNNNPITISVAGGTPLTPGTYPLLVEGNTILNSISGAFSSTPTFTGAGIASGKMLLLFQPPVCRRRSWSCRAALGRTMGMAIGPPGPTGTATPLTRTAHSRSPRLASVQA